MATNICGWKSPRILQLDSVDRSDQHVQSNGAAGNAAETQKSDAHVEMFVDLKMKAVGDTHVLLPWLVLAAVIITIHMMSTLERQRTTESRTNDQATTWCFRRECRVDDVQRQLQAKQTGTSTSVWSVLQVSCPDS